MLAPDREPSRTGPGSSPCTRKVDPPKAPLPGTRGPPVVHRLGTPRGPGIPSKALPQLLEEGRRLRVECQKLQVDQPRPRARIAELELRRHGDGRHPPQPALVPPIGKKWEKGSEGSDGPARTGEGGRGARTTSRSRRVTPRRSLSAHGPGPVGRGSATDPTRSADGWRWSFRAMSGAGTIAKPASGVGRVAGSSRRRPGSDGFPEEPLRPADALPGGERAGRRPDVPLNPEAVRIAPRSEDLPGGGGSDAGPLGRTRIGGLKGESPRIP